MFMILAKLARPSALPSLFFIGLAAGCGGGSPVGGAASGGGGSIGTPQSSQWAGGSSGSTTGMGGSSLLWRQKCLGRCDHNPLKLLGRQRGEHDVVEQRGDVKQQRPHLQWGHEFNLFVGPVEHEFKLFVRSVVDEFLVQQQ